MTSMRYHAWNGMGHDNKIDDRVLQSLLISAWLALDECHILIPCLRRVSAISHDVNEPPAPCRQFSVSFLSSIRMRRYNEIAFIEHHRRVAIFLATWWRFRLKSYIKVNYRAYMTAISERSCASHSKYIIYSISILACMFLIDIRFVYASE